MQIILPALKLIMCSGILYTYYHWFLRNRRVHQFNRFFLLSATLLSLCIPFISIPLFTVIEQPAYQKVYEIFETVSMDQTGETGNPVAAFVANKGFDWWLLLTLIYAIGVAVGLVKLASAWCYIQKLRKTHLPEHIKGLRFYNTADPATPFSFLQMIFWNQRISFNSKEGQQVFQHEYVHVKQKHSYDILFIELVTAFCWFNPVYYFIRKELKTVHEFLADDLAAGTKDKYEYAELLILQSIQHKNQLGHPFFHNQIKRRIAMLTKNTNRQTLLRKFFVFPVAAMLLCVFTFSAGKKKIVNGQSSFEKRVTIVVDAGHGGIDPGVKSGDDGVTEAMLNLEIAKQVEVVAKEFNIDVVMTRTDDLLPGNAADIKTGLKQRAAISNAAKPSAFISIHIDAGSNSNGSQPSGMNAYISGRRKDKNSERFASSILQSLSSIYHTDTVYKQRTASGIWVLDQATCPAVLIECGYMTNERDLAFVTDKQNQAAIARRIIEGVVQFLKD